MSTKQKKNKRKAYPSDISKNGWKRLRKLLPIHTTEIGQGGRPRVDLKEVINAIFYVVKTGGSWRSLPHDFPCWSTVYGYFNRWSKADAARMGPGNGFMPSLLRKSGRK